ncbi:MAG: hypothetical protein JWP72_424 [Massilia sp.]|jgi:SAM-dependent methyltransferase|nr:hypothetical protein [Massilia sp.]
MKTIPEIHLCVQQPAGYLHSLGLVDQARYFRYQFRRLGVRVSMAKNRLRHDAVNFVFGAHLGFDPAQRERYACIFVNLEQVGTANSNVSQDYVHLLETSAVADYDPQNVAGYAADGREVPVVPLMHAPYLAPAQAIPLEERPIDLLFMGSMNERRRAWIDKVECYGLTVSMFDGFLYGAERDAYIMQAKAVLNTPFFDTSCLEQPRVAHCLSLGTPVISERGPQYRPQQAFEDSVFWVGNDDMERFFTSEFASPAFYEAARNKLRRFEQADPIDAYAKLLAFAAGVRECHDGERAPQPWQPRGINLGAGKDYKQGSLNIDALARAEPDLVLDLSAPLALPFTVAAPAAGPVLLVEDSVDLIQAKNVLTQVPDLAGLMGNCLRLLKEGGVFEIEVPYERASSAWQDPTHVRAMNENSWIYFTDWFWHLGWFEHRFEIARSNWLDSSLKECGVEQAAFMHVILRKIATSPRERNTARTMQADLRLPEDPVPAAEAFSSGADAAPE